MMKSHILKRKERIIFSLIETNIYTLTQRIYVIIVASSRIKSKIKVYRTK